MEEYLKLLFNRLNFSEDFDKILAQYLFKDWKRGLLNGTKDITTVCK